MRQSPYWTSSSSCPAHQLASPRKKVVAGSDESGSWTPNASQPSPTQLPVPGTAPLAGPAGPGASAQNSASPATGPPRRTFGAPATAARLLMTGPFTVIPNQSPGPTWPKSSTAAVSKGGCMCGPASSIRPGASPGSPARWQRTRPATSHAHSRTPRSETRSAASSSASANSVRGRYTVSTPAGRSFSSRSNAPCCTGRAPGRPRKSTLCRRGSVRKARPRATAAACGQSAAGAGA
mmetsp:Transcript_116247/g.323781  ORF Transcript_116247/g.323781 Transcript_116247/m.323781 type:complete len:236 (+) Transcript_116247:227-934(+)